MSDLQEAIQTVEDCVKRYGDEVDWVEWRCLKPRLTPDRERVAEAIYFHACIPGDFIWELLDEKAKDHWREYADAAIAAMEGKE